MSALQKYLISGIASAFMATTLTPADAAPHHKSHTPSHTKKSTGAVATPPPLPRRHFDPSLVTERDLNTCVANIDLKTADRLGYSSLRTLRRATALARVMERDGQDSTLIAAIALASYETGIDFDTLLMKAVLESSLGKYDQPILGGQARGPFMYFEAPFSTLFNWFGKEFQNGFYADIAPLIKFQENKNTYTDDPALMEKILALRSDPYVAAFIKGMEMRYDERPVLVAILGREPNQTDFYDSHLLGLRAVTTFFRALRHAPKSLGADIFVTESENQNNRSLFYDSHGKKYTIQQMYNNLNHYIYLKMKPINYKIDLELKNEHCLKPLDLRLPAREKIPVPAFVLPATIPPPPVPPETLPPDLDAVAEPIAQPTQIAPVPQPPAPPSSGPDFSYGP